jgi:NADP-dependent 3-hydroxy acid dehydrogenase YdfG
VETSQKLIVVTGGSKGIDLATLTTELHANVPGAVLHSLPADLSQAEDCTRFAEFVLGLNLPVEVLINNAGSFIPGRLQDEPADGSQLRRMLAVNLLSAYDVTQALLPGFIQRQQGHIFTICSTASIMAYPNGGSYGIAKHALQGVDLPTERFIQADDVAEAIFSAFQLSPHAVVEELLIRPQLGDL